MGSEGVLCTFFAAKRTRTVTTWGSPITSKSASTGTTTDLAVTLSTTALGRSPPLPPPLHSRIPTQAMASRLRSRFEIRAGDGMRVQRPLVGPCVRRRAGAGTDVAAPLPGIDTPLQRLIRIGDRPRTVR